MIDCPFFKITLSRALLLLATVCAFLVARPGSAVPPSVTCGRACYIGFVDCAFLEKHLGRAFHFIRSDRACLGL